MLHFLAARLADIHELMNVYMQVDQQQCHTLNSCCGSNPAKTSIKKYKVITSSNLAGWLDLTALLEQACYSMPLINYGLDKRMILVRKLFKILCSGKYNNVRKLVREFKQKEHNSSS